MKDKISICSECSGIDIDKLEKEFGKENIDYRCIGECGGRYGIMLGYTKKTFIQAESDEEFIEIVKSL